MIEEHVKHLRVPGISARVVVDADYDWWSLGAMLAEGADLEQAQFLLSLAEAFQALPGAAGLMQLQYIAGVLNRTGNKDDVVWLLQELLIRLEDDDD